jgi:hypothetical protein
MGRTKRVMIGFRNVIYTRLELPSGGAGLSAGNRFSCTEEEM